MSATRLSPCLEGWIDHSPGDSRCFAVKGHTIALLGLGRLYPKIQAQEMTHRAR